MMENSCSGSLIIVAAPSGGGKTSLVKELIRRIPDLQVSISHTTRAMRPGEIDGVDYFFVSDDTFDQLVAENAFVEHARVFNHQYGTSFAQIKSRLAAGIDIVLDIDWQGAQQIRTIFSDAVSVFVIPPSLEVLKQRLTKRQQDNEEVIESRMQRACDEMSHYSEFDYLIVNDGFEKAADELESIVIANRLKMERQRIEQAKLLSFLLR